MARSLPSIRELEPEWTTLQTLNRFTQQLIQTPSLSTQEGDVAALVADHLDALGFANVRLNAMGSLIATLGNGDGPTLLYDAHMDTVAPASTQWPHPPYDGVIQDGRLYGLGAVDMKSALACMIYGAAALLPYLQALGAKAQLKQQQERVRAQLLQPPAGSTPLYYDQVLGLFGTGWMEQRYQFLPSGRLQLRWEKACPQQSAKTTP